MVLFKRPVRTSDETSKRYYALPIGSFAFHTELVYNFHLLFSKSSGCNTRCNRKSYSAAVLSFLKTGGFFLKPLEYEK